MKLLGHPIHPIVIHFPAALLPMDFLLSLLYYFTNDQSFGAAGLYCLTGGVIIGFVAIITGSLDLLNIPKSNREALVTGIYHGSINGIVIFAFTFITYNSWQSYPQTVMPTTVGILIKGFLIIALFIGNYMGGSLIYKHHIGINLKGKEHGEVA